MFLICGLGNPGKEYVNTRHNIGFQLVDKLSNFYNFSSFKKDNKKEVFKGSINNNTCLLMKPLNFMNLSGQPIQDIKNFYKIDKNKLFIIHDDLDLGLGKVKIKFGGGNGGHHPGLKHQVSNYVLNKFTDEEINEIENKLNKITKNFEILLSDPSLFLTKIAEEK